MDLRHPRHPRMKSAHSGQLQMGASEASTASSREPSEAANTNPPSSQISVEAESTASSSDTDDDSDPTPDTFKRLLENCLGNIQTTGTFATSGRLPDATLPGSKVHNVGSVGAPLAESQANAIRDLCHQVPFGQGRFGLLWKSPYQACY